MKLQSPITWLNGRAARAEYLLWVVIFYALIFAVGRWGRGMATSAGADKMTVGLIVTGASMVFSLAIVGAQVRRFHDLGRSGWWVLALNGPIFMTVIIPMTLYYGHPLDYFGGPMPRMLKLTQIGLMLLLVLPPGQRGENRFGLPRTGRPFAEIFG